MIAVAPAGAEPEPDARGEQFTPFRNPCDIWEIRREDWTAAQGP